MATSTPEPTDEKVWTSDLQNDFLRILSVGEECISPPELQNLLLAKGRSSNHPQGINLYDGFEPSGRMHIAQGVFKAMNVNKCTYEGTNSTFIFWVADWFALMNDKMGGDLNKIKIVGEYLIQVWKAAGMNLDHVVFKWASEEITNNAHLYWPTMLDVARRFNVTRIKKCCQIMGRLEGSLTSAQVLYPLMQCTDVFFLKADICQLGVDQRKVNMLAREYCDAAKIKNKPIILSHHMLYGLKQGQEKMSKSDPDSAIFMEDTADDVERKIMAAYCPSTSSTLDESSSNNSTNPTDADDAGKESMHLTTDTLKNPCLDYIQNIIFSPPGASFTANGTNYDNFESVKHAFLSGDISEEQLKSGLISELNKLLEPVRNHFTHDDHARGLLEQVRQFKKESSDASTTKKEVRRLDLVSKGKVPSDSHVVFAPLPYATPTLQDAVDVLSKLKSDGDEERPKVLFISDWSARVCNSCDADIKVIDAFYTILISAMKSLDGELMQYVTVVKQSDAILVDPSNYWISVINIGRYFMLDDVMGSNLKDSDGVGGVISRLMKIADVMGLEPTTIVSLSNSEDELMEMSLVQRYFTEVLNGSMNKPNITSISSTCLQLQKRESIAHKTDNDEYFILDDPKVHGKAKMKKAFCEPGNVDFCPPIILSFTFTPSSSVVIQRSPENGGDVTYNSKEQMEDDFKSEALHPGDLKAKASTIMVSVLDKITSGIKADPEVSKAVKALKAFEKKMSKAKK